MTAKPPARFAFRGNSMASGGYLTRLDGKPVPLTPDITTVHGESCLPPSGGVSHSIREEPALAFAPWITYGRCETRAEGAISPDGSHKTTVFTSVQKVHVMTRPSPEDRVPGVRQIAVEAASIALTVESVHPRDGQPVFRLSKPPVVDGLMLRIDPESGDARVMPIQLVFNHPLVNGYTMDHFEREFVSDRCFFDQYAPFCCGAAAPRFGRKPPRNSSGYLVTSIVQGFKLGDKFYQGNEHVEPGFGLIRFGSMLADGFSRRITLLETQFGSDPAGASSHGGVDTNGVWGISGANGPARVLVVCLILLAACTRPSATPSAVSALRDGNLSETLRLARADPSPAARLIEAEALLREGGKHRAEAGALLAAISPATPELRARHLTLQAVLHPGPESRAQLLQAQDLARAANSTDALLDAQNWEGLLLGQAGQSEEAEKVLLAERAAALRASDRYHDALALNGLGMIRLGQGRFDEAATRFQQVLEAAKQGGGKRQAETATLNLGICYARLGVFDRALATLQQALDLIGDTGPLLLRMNALGEMGSAYLLAGDPRKAANYYRSAAALAQSDRDLARWHGDLATALADLHDWDAAERSNEQARAHATALDARAFVVQRAATIASGRRQFPAAIALYREALAMAADKAPVVAWEAHAGLVEAYTGAGDHARALCEFAVTGEYIDSHVAAIASDAYKLTFFARLIVFYQSYVRALVDHRKAYDLALEIADGSRARLLYQRLALRPLRRALSRGYTRIAAARDAVLLFYWVAPERSYLWVARATASTRPSSCRPRARSSSGSRSTTRSSTELGDPMARPSEAGRHLYDALLAPALRLIPPGAKVILTPDRALHWLNFETLPVYGDAPHYVAEDVRLAIAPSLGVLAGASRPVSAAPGSLLIVGDPVSPGPEFPALGYAAREIETIPRRIPGAQVVSGAAATPQVYPRAAAFSLLHFSAHAVANQQNPLDSAIVLSRGAGDFRLYARDVMSVPLRAER